MKSALTQVIREKFAALGALLNERTRRRWAAVEARVGDPFRVGRQQLPDGPAGNGATDGEYFAQAGQVPRRLELQSCAEMTSHTKQFILARRLSEKAIANLHEVLALGAEQITGQPYRGTIEEGNGVKAENWITIEGVMPGNHATAGSCKNASIPEGGSAAANIGTIYGCIMLGTHRDEASSTETILHELGHAMGFYHTSNERTLMFSARHANRHPTFTPQEQYHTQLAYRHPRGTTYRAIKLSTFGPQRHLRPRQIDPRPIFIVD